MTSTFITYQNDLRSFYNKHLNVKVHTSSFENNEYYKTYISEDGAVFTEVNMNITEVAHATIHGLIFEVPVQLMRTEYWSTDNSKSRFVYSK